MYTDDLNSYFQRLKERVKEEKSLLGISTEDRKTPPKGGGWVVEIRGFTYHEKQHDFLLDTLVDNLNTKRLKPAEPKDAAAKSPAGGGKERPEEGGDRADQGQHQPCVMFPLPGKKEDNAGFEFIKESLLMPLVLGAVATDPAKGPTPPPPPPTKGGSGKSSSANSRANWRPLGRETQASQVPKAPDSFFDQVARPARRDRGGQKGRVHSHRVHCVIRLCEPTPSDALRKSGGSSTQTVGGPPGRAATNANPPAKP